MITPLHERRLERCRDELADPASQFIAASHLARQRGFRDTSSLGRSFRTAYGMSPREWRAAMAAAKSAAISAYPSSLG
jgi:AraC family transcriptional regulator, positive regulator of tynA and feaB